MAKTGDSYTIKFKSPHDDWGKVRKSKTRTPREDETYIAIPADDARRLELYNTTGAGGEYVYGKNVFNYKTEDGECEGVLRAQGSQGDGTHAKQFSVDKDLQALKKTLDHIGIKSGDDVTIEFTSSEDIVIKKG